LIERIQSPGDLARETLFHSYLSYQWPRWFAAAGIANVPAREPTFDSSMQELMPRKQSRETLEGQSEMSSERLKS
jgi:hypothetical protein